MEKGMNSFQILCVVVVDDDDDDDIGIVYDDMYNEYDRVVVEG